MKGRRIILILILIVTLAVVSLSLIIRGKERSVSFSLKGGEEKADVTVRRVHYVRSEGSRKVWELQAALLSHYQREGKTKAKDLRMTLWTKDGRVITVKGREGWIKGKEGEYVQLQGDVLITTSDGYRVRTDSLTYDGRRKLVWTSSPVELSREGMVLKGVGLRVAIEEKTFQVLGQVSTTIREGGI